MSQTTTHKRILITGASGCVGQYTTSWLLENSDAELLLWLRDPSKLTAVSANHPRIQLLVGDLREADRFASELASVQRVIHTATAWGDPERAQQVNVAAVKRMLSLLNPSLIEQITYFSTASILDRHLQPLTEALAYGTEYIQTKAQCLQDLEQHPLAEKIVAVFPTLVFGGRVDGSSPFPTSYLTEGLAEASKWLWLARFLRADASFHFIHAADIAAICGHLATHPHQRNREPGQGAVRRIVMGQQAISVNEAVASLCRWRGIRRTPGIPLWPWLIETLIRVLPIEVNAWDRFSIRQRHFIHEPATQPERFGEKSHAADLEAVLQDSGLPRRGSP
ncbi:3 beta-hydroxysteroid dehydrogenase/Delta 5--_4-isomerase [Synechococcus sp. MIT S9509]|uniref:NAD-dependent epimerase/dehydratase family protein n=1 Tax=unclassified Synechococcus TaxID=2626047 RepID=UPI0007BB0380|nr:MULTISPECIES: NAD(P)-dependent oxidoreductase [unclassified Synechococcus]KZR85996.1 3 beta-hydroxysteroid dehydrogenase/Delta 5-->4-isomerase [Synechococcus sp. MIT S9504]KZR92059.1 3 beta-hydroxysteroid dehydrogenase/Delta 5-->4-isomerase [Synechococcus sp. MIT S9509]